jgi:hypothetical protein
MLWPISKFCSKETKPHAMLTNLSFLFRETRLLLLQPTSSFLVLSSKMTTRSFFSGLLIESPPKKRERPADYTPEDVERWRWFYELHRAIEAKLPVKDFVDWDEFWTKQMEKEPLDENGKYVFPTRSE